MTPHRNKAQVLPEQRGSWDGPPARSAKLTACLRLMETLNAFDDRWDNAFGDIEFFDLHYAMLFRRLWATQGRPVTRSEAYSWMNALSNQTAMKYVNRALAAGFLAEVENPDDRRSKLLVMTPRLNARVTGLMESALEEFRRAL